MKRLRFFQFSILFINLNCLNNNLFNNINLKRDITVIENVQRRANKLVKQFKNLDYSERLVKLNLTSLEDRRTRGYLIQFFKCYTGTNIVNWHIAPSFKVKGRTRKSSNQHSFVRPLPATCQLREHFFT